MSDRSASRFRVNAPNVTHETIDGEAVIINLDSGVYYSLDGVGANIWNLLDAGRPVEGIEEWLAAAYEEDEPDGIPTAVDELVTELSAEHLIVPMSEEHQAVGADVEPGPPNDDGKRAAFVKPLLQRYSDMQELLLLDPIHEVDETGWPNLDAKPPENR